MKLSHEKKVERFYSHGSDVRGTQEGGYLSFGYWKGGVMDYHGAVDALVEKVLKKEKKVRRGTKVLNAACGYGAETFRIFDKIKPDKIVAIDITGPHISFARRQARAHKLDDRIEFRKMNAAELKFPSGMFDYVIAIEGPAHFHTREMFLRRAFSVLKPRGVLLLSDIIVDFGYEEGSRLKKIAGEFCARRWFMPRENWMKAQDLKELMKEIGFKIDSFETAGADVYPGFSKYNLRWESIKNAVRIRGFRIGLSLTFISWLLGFVYRKKMIDYIFVRAIKQ